MFMNYGAFMALGLVAADRGSEDLDAFRGLGWRDAPTAAALAVCLVSLVGLPPLGGFIVKWWLIYALGAAALHSPFLWVLAGAVVINTALSLFYYMRVVAAMYLGAYEETGALRAPLSGKVALHLCAIILLLTGTLWIAPLKRNADGVAAAAYSPRSVNAGAPVETSISVAGSANVR
jgi:NADH-quinone oxidoreductase subunit N